MVDIAAYLPANILTNEDLEAIHPEWPATKIYEKTGIKTRHIAAPGETASDLAFEAAQNLFKRDIVRREDVDFIILCTQAPDYILPTSACVLQHRLGIPRHAGALDINLGCSGYVYGLSLAKGLIETGAASCVLLLTADTYSKYIHPLDKSVRTLFGDAGAATAVVADYSDSQLLGPFVFGTDGSGAKNLIVEAGSFRRPADRDSSIEYSDGSGNTRTAENLYMDGAEVMAFSLKEVPKALDLLLSKAGYNKEDIDFFVLHQANKFMLEALRKKLKVSADKFPVYVENYGNTVSSTIPLALIEMRRHEQLKQGTSMVLLGFGVGYSWAGCVLKF